MLVAFTYNVKHNTDYSVEADQSEIEFDDMSVINSIEKAIKSLGHDVLKIEADLDAYNNLRDNKDKIDIVFNIAEGLGGDARESQIPIFCEMLGIPYTHSSPTTHAIKLDKQLTKVILDFYGVNIPKSQVVTSSNEEISSKLKYPLIVKPNKQGSSKGIFNDSVVKNKNDLKVAIDRVLAEYDIEALVEEYIEGREFTVAMLGNPPKVLPIVEQKFDFLPEGFNKVAGYELKWIYEDALDNLTDAFDCPAKVTPELEKLINSTCIKVWDALQVKDCARIDYRLNAAKELYFIEINTLPGINPDITGISYFPVAARKSGLTYEQLIDTILNSALDRYKNS